MAKVARNGSDTNTAQMLGTQPQDDNHEETIEQCEKLVDDWYRFQAECYSRTDVIAKLNVASVAFREQKLEEFVEFLKRDGINSNEIDTRYIALREAHRRHVAFRHICAINNATAEEIKNA